MYHKSLEVELGDYVNFVTERNVERGSMRYSLRYVLHSDARLKDTKDCNSQGFYKDESWVFTRPSGNKKPRGGCF